MRRVHDLRHVLAAGRFVSGEPLLGPLSSPELKGVDWLIVGGESGHQALPVDASWVTELRDACANAEVAFFFKQLGGRTPKAGGVDLEGRTWDALPLAHHRWPLTNQVKRPQHAFTTASKKAPSTVYLDLFAGQATNVSRDTGRPIEGSLLRGVCQNSKISK